MALIRLRMLVRRATVRSTASRVDLVFGSNSDACDDAKENRGLDNARRYYLEF